MRRPSWTHERSYVYEEDLGRGKQQRKEVTYACEPMSDDDDENSPSDSSSSSDKSSSLHMYIDTKISDRELTSAIELSTKKSNWIISRQRI